MNSIIEAWRERILAFDRDMEEIRGGHGHGRTRPVYSSNPLDLYRSDDTELNWLYELIDEDTEVLDVGGGAGRLAASLATRAKRVTVVDPSAESIELLMERASEIGLSNITAVNERWEDSEVPAADIALCSLVLHHVLDVAPFIRKMEERAKSRVVVMEMVETPGALDMPFYERVYGARPTMLPGLPDLLNLLWAMGIFPDVTMLSPETATLDADREGALDLLRRRLAVKEGSEVDERLRVAVEELLEDTPHGLTVQGVAPRRRGIVSWTPTRKVSGDEAPN